MPTCVQRVVTGQVMDGQRVGFGPQPALAPPHHLQHDRKQRNASGGQSVFLPAATINPGLENAQLLQLGQPVTQLRRANVQLLLKLRKQPGATKSGGHHRAVQRSPTSRTSRCDGLAGSVSATAD